MSVATPSVVAAAKVEELLMRWLCLPEVHAALLTELAQLHPIDTPSHTTTSTTTSSSSPGVAAFDAADAAASTPPLAREASPQQVAVRQHRRRSSSSIPPLPRASLAAIPTLNKAVGSTIPRFYHAPHTGFLSELDQHLIAEVEDVFGSTDIGLALEDFEALAKVCGLCSYLAADLEAACQAHCGRTGVTAGDFIAYWRALALGYHDMDSKLVGILNPRGRYLAPKHWLRFVRYVVAHHPGLEFLVASPEYHARYTDTVVARLFYGVNRSVAAPPRRGLVARGAGIRANSEARLAAGLGTNA
jgi:hypothetical protein